MNLPSVTISEKVVDVGNLAPEDINIWDIFWALSNSNRYKGATPVPWSVLNHTGLGFPLILREKPNTETQVAFLLHDGAEAYLDDLHVLMKIMPQFAEFCALEEKIQYTILGALGVDVENVDWDLIHKYDLHCTYIEMSLFYPQLDAKWAGRNKQFDDLEPRWSMLTQRTPEEFVNLIRSLCLQAPEELFVMPRLVQLQLTPEAETLEEGGVV